MRACLLLLLLLPQVGLAQSWVRRQWDHLINDTTRHDAKDGIRFKPYPVLSTAPETGPQVGVLVLGMFQAGGDATARPSQLQLDANVTAKGQYLFGLQHVVSTAGNRWQLTGNLNFRSWPLSYYGLGPWALAEGEQRMKQKQFQLQQRALRSIGGPFYVGMQVTGLQVSFVEFERPAEVPLTLPGFTEGGYYGGGPILWYEGRDFLNNPLRGLHIRLQGQHFDKAWGSDASFSQLETDVRGFLNLGGDRVLAFQTVGWFSQNGTPLPLLPLLGGERQLRGLYQGRWRDNQAAFGQVELRWPHIVQRWGCVVFVGGGAVAPTIPAFDDSPVRWSGGFGLRYDLLPAARVNFRIDFGIGPDTKGIYVGLNEAF